MSEKISIQVDKTNFIYSRSSYYGQVKPKNLIFNANLQEFSQRVNFICNLETNGKLSPEDAYTEINVLWKQLKRTKKQLGIGRS